MREPLWLAEAVVLAIHERQLSEHGGIPGIRDENLLRSALERPINFFNYSKPKLHELAAAYAFGLIKNHPFLDGNKRTGFLAAYVFLAINGYRITALQEEVVLTVSDLAAGKISQEVFSAWLKMHSAKSPRK